MIVQSLKTAQRAWRTVSAKTLLVGIVIGVAALTAVSALGERVGNLMRLSANDFLGGDIALVSREALDPAWALDAQNRGLKIARTVSFPSMVFGAEAGQLADIKAVEPAYPLRGQLELKDALDAQIFKATGAPARGEAWIDEALLRGLALNLGDTVDLGDASFKLTRIVVSEPDRGGGFFAFAPRLMIALEDLAGTALNQEGSRINYRLLVAGEPRALQSFEDWLTPRLANRARLQTLEDSQAAVAQALERAQAFLNLAALCAVVLAGVAIMLSARRFTELEAGAVAVMKSLGATSSAIRWRYRLAVVWLSVPAGVLGAILGYLAQAQLLALIAPAEALAAPAASLNPGLLGLALAVLLAGACVLPSVSRLSAVSPLKVLKNDLPLPASRLAYELGLPMLILAMVATALTGDIKLAGQALGGLILGALVVTAIAGVLLKLVPSGHYSALHVALGNLKRQPATSLIQLGALSLGFAALALIGVLSRDLLNSWQLSLDANTPNYFLLNVQPEQEARVAAGLRAMGSERLTAAPLAIGRLVAINQRPIAEIRLDDQRANERLNRNQNFSWSETLPLGNTLTAGRWWQDDGVVEVSVADTWAEPLGVGLNDTLTLKVADREVIGVVTSVREVAWDSFAVNFFIVLEPSAARELPHSFLLSVFLPESAKASLQTLLRDEPNLTAVDVQQALAEVKKIIERASRAVNLVFWFSVIAGFLVLVSAFNASLDARLREAAVMRALGASGRLILGRVLAEFVLVGLVSGLSACVLAWSVGWLLARQIFGIPFSADWMALALLVLLAAGTAGAVGYVAAQRLLKTRALEALRRV